MRFSLRYVLIVLGILGLFPALALATGPPPEYAAVTTSLTGATTLFEVIVTLAVLVTGFFVGRRWFKRV